MPSSRATRAAYSNASSSVTWTKSSTTSRWKFFGTIPAPMPWSLCGECSPLPLRMALFAGSTAIVRSFRDARSLSTRLTPLMCPPVPTPVMR